MYKPAHLSYPNWQYAMYATQKLTTLGAFLYKYVTFSSTNLDVPCTILHPLVFFFAVVNV